MAYCTLSSVIQQLNAESNAIDVSTSVGQNAQIALESSNFRAYTSRLIYEVSSVMTRVMGHVFVPYQLAMKVRRDSFKRNLSKTGSEYQLRLLEEILVLDSVSWMGTNVDSSMIRLTNEDEFSPDFSISIDVLGISQIPILFEDEVIVNGIFGYHNSPDFMFSASGSTVQNAPLTSSGTTLNVSVGTGSSFEILQYLRLEDEYVLVTAINTDALTIERGKNGTTAVSHVTGTVIEKYQGLPEVEAEARRLAVRHWKLKGWPEGAFVVTPEEIIEINPNAVQSVVPKMPIFGSV